jgi:phosphoglycolate phosphatase-like HAD superfamily hydrolase
LRMDRSGPLVVGFDLDMTLVDSRPGIRASLEALGAQTGVAIDADVVLGRLGPKLEWELAQWFPAADVEDACERYRALYWDHCTGDGTTALPGAHDAIAALRADGGRVVVITAKVEKAAWRCLEGTGLHADVVVGWAHGDQKRDALIAHGAHAYVGDTAPDMRAACDAGALAIGVTTGPDDAGALTSAGAEIVIGSLDELPRYLSRIR